MRVAVHDGDGEGAVAGSGPARVQAALEEECGELPAGERGRFPRERPSSRLNPDSETLWRPWRDSPAAAAAVLACGRKSVAAHWGQGDHPFLDRLPGDRGGDCRRPQPSGA